MHAFTYILREPQKKLIKKYPNIMNSGLKTRYQQYIISIINGKNQKNFVTPGKFFDS